MTAQIPTICCFSSRWLERIVLAGLALTLFLSTAGAGTPADIVGLVVDPSDAPVPGAVVTLLNAQGTSLDEVITDDQGRFSVKSFGIGSYELRIRAAHFATRHIPVNPESIGTGPLQVKLEIAGISSEVTVTATRGSVENALSATQFVTVRERDFLVRQPLATIGGALDSAPGIMVQETTRGQSSPYLRGLTGYQTLLLIDGVRFNTSVFRSGPNQYLALVNPSQVERVEAILGPASSMYGSDSMGGTINLITAAPSFQPLQGGSRIHGEFSGLGSYADASGVTDGRVSVGTRRVSWLLGGTFRRLNNLRTGEGQDSRNAFNRFLGLSREGVRDLLGSRLIDTGFRQAGADSKLAWDLSRDQTLMFQFLYSGIDGEHSYRDQVGGLGRLLSRYYPQQVNFGYARYEKQRLGFLDAVTGTFSVNSQSDGSAKQNLKFTDPVITDDSRVDSYGYSVQATTHAGRSHAVVFGGEVYDERISSTRSSFDPVKGTTVQQRANYPDGTRYVTTGLFVQSASELIPKKARAVVGARYTNVRLHTYAARNVTESGQSLGVADSSPGFDDVTFNAAISWQFSPYAGINAMVGRGFRAPNVTDLASLGLTTLGYDIPSSNAIDAGAIMGADSGDGAGSTGKPVQRLGPESLYNYELGLTFGTPRAYARVQAFDFELLNPIAGRTLLFPLGSVPSTIAGIAVTPLAQSALQQQQGVVAVATSLSPRSVKSTVNDGHSKYYGIESLFRIGFHLKWSVEGNYSFMAGRDLYPNRPARRLPPQQGALSVRFTPGSRFWVELRNRFAGAQVRLNGGDIDDDRIGAARSRTDIANFFRGGLASPYIQAGPDGKTGTADDVFAVTGETLRQVQDRMLPIGATINGVLVAGDGTKVPLYLETAGWYTLDVLGALSLGEGTILHFGIGNLGDRNYRIHGSGVDGAGRSAYAGIRYRF